MSISKSQLLEAVRFASVYAEDGRWCEAIKFQERVVSVRRTKFGPGHSETIEAMEELATSYWNLSRLPEALRLQSEIMNVSKEALVRMIQSRSEQPTSSRALIGYVVN